SVALSFGAVIGVAQGLVLWYHLQDRALSLFWVLISTLFGPIGLVVGIGLSLALGLTKHALYGPVLAAATGAAVGYFQGPGLRCHSRRVRWWALTTAVGGAVAAAVGLTATGVIPIKAVRIVLAAPSTGRQPAAAWSGSFGMWGQRNRHPTGRHEPAWRCLRLPRRGWLLLHEQLGPTFFLGGGLILYPLIPLMTMPRMK
ncbi:MAG: hypothetical protein M1325_02200, partial [Actinobacteria bacterium]|nr:hypothetical protein [Actinomycetota bacterium]